MRRLSAPFRRAAVACVAACLAAAPAAAEDRRALGFALTHEAVERLFGDAAEAALAAALEADAAARAEQIAPPEEEPGLFVGPRRAWIVLAERRRLEDAQDLAAAFGGQGVETTVLARRDGGYDLALAHRPVGEARRALQSWRRIGLAEPESRLDGGAGYAYRLPRP